jgi:hypothetical protein
LKGVIDENQFYQKSDTKKSFASLDFSNSERSIDIDIDFIDTDKSTQETKIQFECNVYLAGEILDNNFSRLSVSFLGYDFTREIVSTKKVHVSFSTSDLCIVTLTFCISSPI